MKKAMSVTNLYNKRFKLMQFEGEWYRSFGTPEHSGSWLVFGDSGNGKTSFLCQLAKHLSNFGRVCYNSLEEGISLSMREAFKRVGMEEAGSKVILLDAEPIDHLVDRLRKHKSPEIVIIDSIDYAGITYKQYKEIKEEFPTKLFILTAHASGRLPDSRIARKIRFDAHVKAHVHGYKVFPTSRYGGGEPYTIWHEGAEAYHGISN